MSEYPLHVAAEKCDFEKVKQLVEQGVSVDSRDDYGQTPLHRAKWDCKIAEYLIGQNCDINARGQKGQTPVVYGASWGRRDFVLFLLRQGAQANFLDDDNKSVLHFASCRGLSDVVQVILDTGEADVNSPSKSGFTPLMRAAHRGHRDIVSLLIRAGADVNHRENFEQRTPLHWAAREGRVEATQVLLQAEGVDINSRDSNGWTPLYDACSYSRPEVAKLLLNAGAATNIKKNSGLYAFSCAIRNIGDWHCGWTLEVLRLFILKGAFFDDDYGDYAFSSKNAFIRENVLNDVELCTKLIENKYNYQSLETVYSNPYFSKGLPPMKDLKLQDIHSNVIKAFVESEIETKTFCNVKQARPIVLHMMCVESLLGHLSSMKRSASQAAIGSTVASKRTRLT